MAWAAEWAVDQIVFGILDLGGEVAGVIFDNAAEVDGLAEDVCGLVTSEFAAGDALEVVKGGHAGGLQIGEGSIA